MSDTDQSKHEPAEDQGKSISENSGVVSSNYRGGPWLPVVLAAIGAGVLLSGIFSGAIGLYGTSGEVSVTDGFVETGREAMRLVVFSLLLLGALRIHCWRSHRPLGNILLAALRCLAVIALVEAVRVTHIEPVYVRVPLIIAAQYIIATVAILGLFVMTIRDSVLFVAWCTAGTALLWLGALIGIWIA